MTLVNMLSLRSRGYLAYSSVFCAKTITQPQAQSPRYHGDLEADEVSHLVALNAASFCEVLGQCYPVQTLGQRIFATSGEWSG